MESYQKIVSSRGILCSCDLYSRAPTSSTPHVEFGESGELASGGSIYCCTDALENFANGVIDEFSMPFVLVSGDSDTVVSPRTLGQGVFEKILTHPTLLRWYAQNLGAAGEELHFLPIGVDYHTMWTRPHLVGYTVRRSAFEQERVLFDVRFGMVDRGPISFTSATGLSFQNETYSDNASTKLVSFGTTWRLFYDRTYGINVGVNKRLTYEFTDAANQVHEIPSDLSYSVLFVFRQAMNFAWEFGFSNAQSLKLGENWRNGWSWNLQWHFLY